MQGWCRMVPAPTFADATALWWLQVEQSMQSFIYFMQGQSAHANQLMPTTQSHTHTHTHTPPARPQTCSRASCSTTSSTAMIGNCLPTLFCWSNLATCQGLHKQQQLCNLVGQSIDALCVGCSLPEQPLTRSASCAWRTLF